MVSLSDLVSYYQLKDGLLRARLEDLRRMQESYNNGTVSIEEIESAKEEIEKMTDEKNSVLGLIEQNPAYNEINSMCQDIAFKNRPEENGMVH